MNYEPLVSVVIPIYNVEKFLSECISSVINQDYKNLEILLIDDCSTDKSLEICYQYKESDSRIKVIEKEKNEGQSVARNIGIRNATGEYIYFLDSDDYIKKGIFTEVIGYMQSNDLDLCYFSAEVFLDGEGLEWDEKIYIKNHEYGIDTGQGILKKLNKYNEYTVSNCMFITRLSLIRRNNIQYHENVFYEDNYVALLIALSAKKASVLNEIYYIRRIRPNSTMTSIDKIEFKIYSYIRNIDDFSVIKNISDRNVKKIIKKHIQEFGAGIINESLKLKNKNEIKKVWKYLLNKKFFYDFKLVGYFILKLTLKLNIFNKRHYNMKSEK